MNDITFHDLVQPIIMSLSFLTLLCFYFAVNSPRFHHRGRTRQRLPPLRTQKVKVTKQTKYIMNSYIG